MSEVKPICNPETTRLDEAEDILFKFVQLSMQGNHFGKSKDCPSCHIMLEAIAYCNKHHSVDNIPPEHREEALKALEEAKTNPRKFIFS